MLYLPERLVLWLGWIALSSALFTAFPLGPYGLLGWLGAVGPLIRKIVPALSARHLAAGVLAVMLIVVVVAGDLSWAEILLPPAIFVIGLLLAPVPITGWERTIEGDASTTQLIEEEFQRALNREVGRSRRYQRSMTLLSATCEQPEKNLRTLEAAIASVVHIYVLVFPLGDHLFVIVPELPRADCETLKHRILAATAERNLPGVSLRSASFPDEEVTSSGLIDSINGTGLILPLRQNGAGPREAHRAKGAYGAGLRS